AAYADLFDAYELAPPDDVFAVGYPVDGVRSRSVLQVEEGLRTVVPLILELAEDAGLDLVAPFVDADVHARAPLGERFAGWLAARGPGRPPGDRSSQADAAWPRVVRVPRTAGPSR